MQFAWKNPVTRPLKLFWFWAGGQNGIYSIENGNEKDHGFCCKDAKQLGRKTGNAKWTKHYDAGRVVVFHSASPEIISNESMLNKNIFFAGVVQVCKKLHRLPYSFRCPKFVLARRIKNPKLKNINFVQEVIPVSNGLVSVSKSGVWHSNTLDLSFRITVLVQDYFQ